MNSASSNCCVVGWYIQYLYHWGRMLQVSTLVAIGLKTTNVFDHMQKQTWTHSLPVINVFGHIAKHVHFYWLTHSHTPCLLEVNTIICIHSHWQTQDFISYVDQLVLESITLEWFLQTFATSLGEVNVPCRLQPMNSCHTSCTCTFHAHVHTIL